ncbi:1-acyl-sn-glycerol-3-phosphate acyltransferase, partial [Escherichia coli]|nr:1-acyl-sn-glycerol-3-phosphate acyltransferase [Escherichia coli]
MAYAWRWLRSLMFVGQMYLMMLVIGLIYTVPALASRDGAFRAIHAYCRWVRWTAGWMVGLRSEVRGEVP